MIQEGSLVKILYPIYPIYSKCLFEFYGVVETSEEFTGRWIVRLINNPVRHGEELLLSLKESEIELLCA